MSSNDSDQRLPKKVLMTHFQRRFVKLSNGFTASEDEG